MKNLMVPVDQDLNSTIRSNPEFPFFLFHDDLKEYVGGFVNWHKQSSIEIAVVLEGGINVSVLEQEASMEVGDGFLILPERLHTVKPAKDQTAAKYFTIFFEPMMLFGYKGSFLEKQYYLPALSSEDTFFQFNVRDEWTKPVFEKLKWIYDRFPNDSTEFRITVQRMIQDLWLILWENLLSKQTSGVSAQHNTRILAMIEYLHKHYTSKFSLTAMAMSVNVSRGECCRFFKKMMHMTISDYLMEYRVSKAAELLETTNLPVSDISEKIGFSSISYFIESFKKKTGYSPLAYQKKLRETPHTEDKKQHNSVHD